jgi:sugar lactone lactonase YvrE
LNLTFLAIWCAGTTWKTNGTTVAGGNGQGDSLNQLNGSYAVFVDSDDALFITDYYSHRVVKWNRGATNGTLVAGGQCGQIDQGQLCYPTAMTFDKDGTMFVTVEDGRNGGVISWKKGATSGETLIIANTSFYGITLDAEEKYLYLAHHREHRVVKYTKDGIFESVVAGGNGNGAALNQLDYRKCVKRCPI